MLLNQEEIEEVEEIIDGKHYKCIGCDCDCSTCEEFISNVDAE